MIDIIEKLFQQNGFENTKSFNIPDEQVLFMRNLKDDAVNFYMIMFKESISDKFLEEEMWNYYSKLKDIDEEEYDERIDKNLSLIIFLKKNEDINEQTLMKEIFNIEENPYYFKKYVCTYTDKQEKAFKTMINSNTNENIMEIISPYISNKIEFQNFKQTQEQTLYELCITLIIKIPFLVLEQENDDIEDLQQNIQKELKTKNLFDLTEIMEILSEIEDDKFDEELERLLLEVGGLE